MALDHDNTRKKYTAIRSAYQKWSEKRYKGVRVYTDDYILRKLEDQFYMRPATLEDVVFHRTKF